MRKFLTIRLLAAFLTVWGSFAPSFAAGLRYAPNGIVQAIASITAGQTTITGLVPVGATANALKNGTSLGAATINSQGLATYTLPSAAAAQDSYSFAWTLTGATPTFTVPALTGAAARQLPTVSAAPLAVYGLTRMVAGATSAVRVQRGSDTTSQTDLGFDANGVVDMSAASTFANGSELRVVSLYEQSGKYAPAVSAASGSAVMPILTTMQAAYGSAFSATPIILHQGLGYPYPSNVYAGLTLPAALTADQANVSIFDVAASNAGRRSQIWGGLGSGGASSMLGVGGGGFSNFAYAADGTTAAELYANGASAPRVNLQVINVNSRATGRSLWVEDISTTSATALPSKTLTGGNMGGGSDTNSSLYFTGHRSAFVVYPALSEADAASVRSTLSTSYNTAKRAIRLVQAGSSIPEGRGADNRTVGSYSTQSTIMLALGSLDREIDVWNLALSGRSSESVQSAMSSEVAPLVLSGGKNIFLIDVGGNSLTAGDTGAQVYAINKNAAAAAKSAGYNQIIAATIAPRVDITGQTETERQNLNNLIVNGSADFGWSANADYASIPEFATITNTYYQSDGQHFTNAGQSKRVPKLLSGLQGIVNGSITGPAAPAAPGQVTGLTAGTATSSTQPLSWAAPASGGAPTSYLMEYRTTAGPGAWTSSGTATGTSGTVTGLTAATGYDFRVTATNGTGSGSPSSIVSATTAAADTITGPAVGEVFLQNVFFKGGGGSAATSAAGWNNLDLQANKSNSPLALINSAGGTSPLTAFLTNTTNTGNTQSVSDGQTVVPGSVASTFIFADKANSLGNGASSLIKATVAGLSAGTQWRVEVFAYRNNTATRLSDFTVAGQTITANTGTGGTPTAWTATFNNVAPTNGVIEVNVTQNGSENLAYLNAFRLTRTN